MAEKDVESQSNGVMGVREHLKGRSERKGNESEEGKEGKEKAE